MCPSDRVAVHAADTAGDGTDLPISDAGLGRALAATFGQADIALVRGHGSTVVADCFPLAAYRAVCGELDARDRLQAGAPGEVACLAAAQRRAA